MKYYIVSFDRTATNSYKGFHKDFVAHTQILKWFHYIKSSYIIGTTLTEDEITDHFLEVAGIYDLPKSHLVVRVNLSYHQGWLTDDAWNWLNRNSKS